RSRFARTSGGGVMSIPSRWAVSETRNSSRLKCGERRMSEPRAEHEHVPARIDLGGSARRGVQKIEHQPLAKEIPANQDLRGELGAIAALARPERPIAVMPDGRADPYRPSAEMRRPEDPGAEVRSDVLVAAVPVTVGSERRKPPPLCELLRHEERIEAHLRADRGLAEPYRQAFGFGRIRPRAVA